MKMFYMPNVLSDESKSVQHAIVGNLAPFGVHKFFNRILMDLLHYIVCNTDHPLEL